VKNVGRFDRHPDDSSSKTRMLSQPQPSAIRCLVPIQQYSDLTPRTAYNVRAPVSSKQPVTHAPPFQRLSPANAEVPQKRSRSASPHSVITIYQSPHTPTTRTEATVHVKYLLQPKKQVKISEKTRVEPIKCQITLMLVSIHAQTCGCARVMLHR